MGVMIEQYRAWIGAHNSIAKTKEDNSHLEGIISNTMPILILLYHSVYLIGYIVYVALLRMVTDCKFAIMYTQVNDMLFTNWDSPFLNIILCAGNNLYICISNAIKNIFCY